MDTNESNGPDQSVRKSRINSGIVAAGVAFGLTLAGLGVAAAQTDSGSDTTTTTDAGSSATAGTESAPNTAAENPAPSTAAPDAGTTPAPAVPDPGQRMGRPAETELTGDVAEKVKAAALAAVPGGTIIRVETDSDGSPYEAHVRKADGTEVVVKVNEAFAVTATEDHMGPGPGGHHGPGGPGGPGAGETALTGDVAAKVTAAAQAAVPGGTVLRVETDSDGSPYEAHVRKADGTEVEVKVNESFQVTSTQEHTGMRGPRPPAGPTD